MTNVAVVGIGGWGRNLARNFYEIPDATLRYVCDLDEGRLKQFGAQHPGVQCTSQFDKLIDDPKVEAVIVATTAGTHYELCRKALAAGKDVYVEKPFVLRVEHAHELIESADAGKRVLMVGHLLKYHPVVEYVKKMLESGELGDVYYIYSQRLNLGTVRDDENALWSFAPHDISVILYWLGQTPTDVSARGQSYLHRNVEDVVFLTMNFGDRSLAHVHVSWLDPHKTRKMTIVGKRKMAVFDDLESNEKLRVYDKGAKLNDEYESYAEYLGLRFGDIRVPYIKVGEPLRYECQHFLDCVRTRATPKSDGRDGLRVVQILNAAQRSLEKNGAPMSVTGP